MGALPLTLEIFTQLCLELGADMYLEAPANLPSDWTCVYLPVAPGNISSAWNTVFPKGYKKMSIEAMYIKTPQLLFEDYGLRAGSSISC